VLRHQSPRAILADYEARKVEPGFDLGAFVHRHFSLPAEGPTVQPASPGEPIETYIVRLWDVVVALKTRKSDSLAHLPERARLD
jgi:hypothetical protein